MRGFFGAYAGVFLRPRSTFAALAAHPRALRWACGAVAIAAANYTLVYFFLAHNGGRPTDFAPWLAIDAEIYYRYNVWFHAPSLALSWVSGAAFAHLAARGLGGRGGFESTLALLGMAASVAMWWTGLHDLITSALGFVGVLDQRAYEDAMGTATPAGALLWTLLVGYALWFFVLFGKAVVAAHRIDGWRAALAGAVGVGVHHAVFLIFNR